MGDVGSWARDLAFELLGEALPRRWAHVQGVAERARVAGSLLDQSDRELLIAAALLHDLGYAPLDGARHLRGVGADERLTALVAHHSCAYHEAELRGLSAELTVWMNEKTPLRDALWWADMTTSPDGETVSFDERLREIQERYGPEDVVTFFIRQARPELRAAVERTESRLRAAGIAYE